MISRTRQEVRFVTGIGFCVLRYPTRDRGYELLGALGCASCDITYETGSKVSYGHWVLHPVISHTKQGVRFVRALESASCDIPYETRGTIYYGLWVLRLVISFKR